MGFVGELLIKVSYILDKLSSVLPTFDLSKVSSSVQVLNDAIQGCNAIFPLDDVSKVLGILTVFFSAMFVFWCIKTAINLIRGAG